MANVTSTTGISQTLGSYSGVTSETIDKLIEAESYPLVKFNNNKSKITAQQNAWKDVRLRLNTLMTKVDDLRKNVTFNTKVASSSNKEKVTITGSDQAIEDTYKVSVERLATATKRTSGSIASLNDKTIYEKLSLSGNLKIASSEGQSSEIQIDQEDSLKTIVNKINGTTKDSGVKATIVDKKLVLSDVKLGARELNVSGDLADTLGFGDQGTLEKGQSAIFKVDGLKITRDSNTIDDVIEGVTINLNGETKDGEDVSVSLKKDTDKIVAAVKGLVDQYNTLKDFIKEKADIKDPSKKDNKAGDLAGDSTLLRLESSLRGLMTSAPGENGTTNLIKPQDIGITSQKWPADTTTLVFDETKFKAALEKDPTAVQNFFSNQVEKTSTSIGEDGQSVTTIEKSEVGYMKNLKELLNGYLSDEKGQKSIITTKSDGFDKSIKELNSKIDKFTEKIAKKREYYVRIYTRLDNVMMQAESQMGYLQSQMDAFSSR